MTHDRKTPAIRFEEFNEGWDKSPLRDLYEYAGSGGTPTSTNKDYYGGSIPFLSIADMTDRVVDRTENTITQDGLEASTAWVVPVGSIALAMYASVGKVGILGCDTATSQAFYNMVFAAPGVRDFVFTRLERAEGTHEWEPHISTGTQRNLNAEKVRSFPVYAPASTREKQQIGSFFAHLDALLTSQRNKVEKLEQLKNAMLDKMFPRDGVDVPEVRFPEFTEPWKEKPLDEIADIVGGGTPSTSVSGYWDGDIDWYAPAEIGESVYVDRSVQRITKEGLRNSSASMLPAHRTVLFTSRAGIGNMAILRRPGCTNQGFQSLVMKGGNDAYFVYSMGGIITEKAIQHASGSTFLEISGKKLGQLSFKFPTPAEQQKVGSFFAHLDSLIRLNSEKLAKLGQVKNALLNRMFV